MSEFFLIVPQIAGLIEGFPHGVVALANYIQVKAPQHKITVLDLGKIPIEHSVEILSKRIKNTNDLCGVGFSVSTATYQAALQLAKAVKKIAPHLPVLFGGPHATHQDDVILNNHPEVDCVIRGEGEKALLSFLRYHSVELWGKIPSASYRKKSSIAKNDLAPLMTEKELSEIPLSLSDIDISLSLGRGHRVAYAAARGCPRKCRFCSAGSTPFRSKSTERIVLDFSYLASCDFFEIAFEDNDFFYSKDRAESICTALSNLAEKYKDLNWDCQIRVDANLDHSIIETMSDSHCSRIFLGMENFDHRCLNFLRKTSNPYGYVNNFIEQTLPVLLSSNIKVSLNLQLGIPIEDEMTRKINLENIKMIGAMALSHKKTVEICPMLHVLYPGTAEFNELSTELSIPSELFEHYTIWESMNPKYNTFLSKNFAHGKGGLPIGILEHKALRNKEFFINQSKIDFCSNFRITGSV